MEQSASVRLTSVSSVPSSPAASSNSSVGTVVAVNANAPNGHTMVKGSQGSIGSLAGNSSIGAASISLGSPGSAKSLQSVANSLNLSQDNLSDNAKLSDVLASKPEGDIAEETNDIEMANVKDVEVDENGQPLLTEIITDANFEGDDSNEADGGETSNAAASNNFELDEMCRGRYQWWESDCARMFMRLCALLSLVSVSLNTSYTYAKVDHLIYVTFVIDASVAFIFLMEFFVKLHYRGCGNYFADHWSQFDFVMLVCLVFSLALHVLELTG